MVKFIIENNDAIWGYGDTEAEAWEMAESEIDPQDNIDDCECVEATDELVAEVEKRGGAISWGKLPNGTRCTNAQESAAV